MQGFLFFEFKQYIQKRLGLNVWDAILKKAGVGPKMYISLLGYPDEEFNAIILAASEITGKSVPFILEDFGMFVMPGYIRIASHKIDPKWNALDLLENVPVVFRHVLVSAFTGSLPPLMKFVRNKPDELAIYYASPRKLCILGRGIIRGFAKYCNNEVKITELSCMLKGDPQCQIIVKLLPPTQHIPLEGKKDEIEEKGVGEEKDKKRRASELSSVIKHPASSITRVLPQHYYPPVEEDFPKAPKS